MLRRIHQYFIAQSMAFKLLLGLFALALTKSIFIFPFTLVPGAPGIVLGVLLCFIVFLLCVVTLYLLDKISWEDKRTAVKWHRILIYMIPPIALNIILLLTFFPGKMSYDSMYIWHTTIIGEYTNLHPITYTLFVNFLNNIVNSPWIVITAQFIYASLVFAYVGYVFEGMGLKRKACWAIILVLTLYPVNFHQSVTMLKDVPYMISLVMISAIMLKIITDGRISFGNIAVLFAVSLIAMFSRHNAVLSVPAGLIILIIYYMARKNGKAVLKVIALLASVMVCYSTTNKILNHVFEGDYWKRSNISDVMMMPSAQCSYTIYKNRGVMSEEMKAQTDRFFNVDYIYYQVDTYKDWAFNNRPLYTLKTNEVENKKFEFLSLYLRLLKEYPKDMLLEYQQITGIIWAIPNYGYTLYRNVGIAEYNVPLGITYSPLLPKLAHFLDKDIKAVFWLRPALWLMLSILLLFASSKRHGMKGLCLIAPMIANAIMFFAGTPAQNVRYFYCNFSIFLIFLVFSLSKKPVEQSEQLK